VIRRQSAQLDNQRRKHIGFDFLSRSYAAADVLTPLQAALDSVLFTSLSDDIGKKWRRYEEVLHLKELVDSLGTVVGAQLVRSQ
jgi:hypothetical protein